MDQALVLLNILANSNQSTGSRPPPLGQAAPRGGSKKARKKTENTDNVTESKRTSKDSKTHQSDS